MARMNKVATTAPPMPMATKTRYSNRLAIAKSSTRNNGARLKIRWATTYPIVAATAIGANARNE